MMDTRSREIVRRRIASLRPPPVTISSLRRVIAATLLLIGNASSQVSLQYPNRDHDAVAQASAYWIGTSGGLYIYRPNENVWSVKNVQSGLPTAVITRLAYDEETMWIGRDRGVTRYDLKSNVMLSYDSTAGIPAGRVLSIAFETDYTWVGTEHGAARYDKLIEQWQTIDRDHGLRGARVHSIAVRDGAAWLFTDEAVNEYEPRYERWRHYVPDAAPLGARDVVLTGTAAWIIRDREMLRFDFSSRIFRSYRVEELGSFDDIRLFAIDGNSIWIVTATGLWYYDAPNDSFRPFLELANLPDQDIRAITVSPGGTSLVFATRTGVSRYDLRDKTWQYFNEASGLPRTDFTAMFSAGSDVIGLTTDAFVYLSGRDSRWYSYKLPMPEVAASTTFSLDPGHGTYADFGSGVRFSLSGSRARWLAVDDDLSGKERLSSGISSLYDLKATLELGGERSISAGYNDADYADVMYGAQYRGAKADIIQSLQVGDVNIEQGGRLFLPSFGMFGAGGRFSFGERTDRYHRARFEIGVAEGHQTTAVTSDFFQGKTRARHTSVQDVDFLRNEFFRLPLSAGTSGVDPATLELYRSVPPAAAVLITESARAGKTAYWDRCVAGEHFTLDADRAIVRYPGGFSRTQALAVRFVDRSGRSHELLLIDDDSSAHELVNRYFLLGTSIVPSTFRMRITTAAGGSIPLAAYGLDADRDGYVDAGLVNFRDGILAFPAERPFPPATYADSAAADLRFDVEFETFTTSYLLSRRNIVRGSEKVLVDGSPVRAGDDYVLDYTSGYLLFTRDGVINDNSRIEVTYEYTRHDADDRYAQLALTYSPSDNAQVSLTGARFRASEESTEHLALSASADLRTQGGALDLRVIPEFGMTRSESAAGFALGLQSWLSTGAFRVEARGRSQQRSFAEKFVRLFPGGRLRDEYAARSEFDVTSFVRLFGEWNRRIGEDSLLRTANDERLSAGLQFVRSSFPSMTLKAERQTEASAFASHTRRAIRVDMDYVMPAEQLGIASGLVSSYVRFSDEMISSQMGAPSESRFQNYYLRAAVSPRPLFTINAYYRGDLQNTARDDGLIVPALATEKVFSDIVIENIRGLSLTGRYVLDKRGLHLHGAGEGYDIDLRRTLQIGSRISPGTYLDALKPFTIDLNAQTDRASYYTGERSFQTLFFSLFRPRRAEQVAASENLFLEGRLEWRPLPELICFITGRHTATTSEKQSSSYTEYRNEVLQRADYRMGSSGLYSAQLSVSNTYSPVRHSRWITPSLWLEQRWSAVLLTRLTFGVAASSLFIPQGRYDSRDITPGLNVTCTFDNVPFLGKCEFRNDFSYTTGMRRSPVTPTTSREYTRESISNSVYLDVYPHPISYIRLQYLAQWKTADNALSSTGFHNSGQIQLVLQL